MARTVRSPNTTPVHTVIWWLSGMRSSGNDALASASHQSRPAASHANPARSMTVTNGGAVTKRTSCPAATRAAAIGAMGWKCPYAGCTENRARTGAADYGMAIPDDPWWRSFIVSLPAPTAKCATVRDDGRPHVTPIWVALDGDDVVFTTHETSLKAKAVRRDPRICLCFDDERPPFAYVMVEGTATLSDDLDELRHWATVIGGRYMGEDRAEQYGARNGVPGEVLVRITPTHVVAQRGVAD